mmetsp:Transcript_53549/g.107540  ORF Transcript_53549/g.107540 Transcript_53549/m.107540 type:complete len:243 (-) Transcript_53549:255-983(-)
MLLAPNSLAQCPSMPSMCANPTTATARSPAPFTCPTAPASPASSLNMCLSRLSSITSISSGETSPSHPRISLVLFLSLKCSTAALTASDMVFFVAGVLRPPLAWPPSPNPASEPNKPLPLEPMAPMISDPNSFAAFSRERGGGGACIARVNSCIFPPMLAMQDLTAAAVSDCFRSPQSTRALINSASSIAAIMSRPFADVSVSHVSLTCCMNGSSNELGFVDHDYYWNSGEDAEHGLHKAQP